MTVFETETAVVVESHREGGTTTGWHSQSGRLLFPDINGGNVVTSSPERREEIADRLSEDGPDDT